MVNSSALETGGCLAPFLPASLYTGNGGFVDGRLCSLAGSTICCLPCPQTDWLYPDEFNTSTRATSYINIIGLACSVFLLASFAALPIEKTHRHYLSVCLTLATVLMQLGFIIPLAAKPPQCADEITPNDMHSSHTCAISGALLVAGGWCGVMWSFMRALSLHLQICWQKVMGKGFMYGAFAAGWGLPAIALVFALVFSGVSFRFGDTCHINHTNGLADFWIPLLVFAALTVALQFATFAYCIKVYIASLTDNSTSTSSSGLPSYAATLRTVSPRQAYERVQRVVQLQWRGLAIVFIIIADVVFFAVVFVMMDNSETSVAKDPVEAEAWITCLMKNGGDKTSCLHLANKLVVNEATVIAVLVLLSLMGVWLLLLLGRVSMLSGWYDLAKSHLRRDKEFVSVDARAFNKEVRSYEMLACSGKDSGLKNLEPYSAPVISPPPAIGAGADGRQTPDYFEPNIYQYPAVSLSSPTSPTLPSSLRRVSDPYASYAAQYRLNPLSMNKL